MEGWYYLHTNGTLIYKVELGGTAADIRESDFAVAMWPMDSQDRGTAWSILVEALAIDVEKKQVFELAEKWGCDDVDALTYAERVGCVLKMDGDQWFATKTDFENLQASPAGFGNTALEAMAALCKTLGYKACKMWGATFKDLLAVKESAQK